MLFQIPVIKYYRILLIYSNPPILPIIAIIANKLFETKIIFVAYDLYPEIGINTNKMRSNGLLAKIMRFINDKLYPNSDVVALSNEMKNFIVKNRKISSDRVHVINNWATEESDVKNPIDSVSKKDENKAFIISYLGNMGIPQDFETLLKAMSSDKIKKMNIEFHFAGHGNQRETIAEYINKNNLANVYLHGFLQEEDFNDLVSKTDVFFLSLKNQLNGLAVPSKYYTYLISRKPILAVINQSSDIAIEIEKHEIGYTVSENDVKGLIDAIMKIQSLNYPNKDIYNTYYSKKINLEKYVNIVTELLEIDKEGLYHDNF